jgi:hypothetical protein
MKKVLGLVLLAITGFLFGVGFAAIALAQTVAVELADGTKVEVTPDFLNFLIASLNGLPGAGVLGGAAIVVQLLLRAMSQPFAGAFFAKRSGLEKIAIVAALTFAVTPLGLMAGAGLSAGAAFTHSATLTAFMVFLNQIAQQATKARLPVATPEVRSLPEAPADSSEGKAS